MRRTTPDPKKCPKCKRELSLTENFYRRSNGAYDGYCKECRKLKTQENFDAERQREYCRRQRQNHPKRVKAYSRKSYVKHQDERRAKQLVYYHEHADRLKENNRARMRRIRTQAKGEAAASP